jgi:transcriptional regulator with XRE-family HTH domain
MNQIKMRRLQLEFTQLDLEKLSGISQTRISLIENDYREPNSDERKKLSKILRASEEELFSD